MEEANVVVVTLSGRARTPDVVRLLYHVCIQGNRETGRTGWLRGQGFIDRTDPCRFFLYQEWTTRRRWVSWFHAERRQRVLRALMSMLEGELQIQVVEEGGGPYRGDVS
jgi:hypothetical protein